MIVAIFCAKRFLHTFQGLAGGIATMELTNATIMGSVMICGMTMSVSVKSQVGETHVKTVCPQSMNSTSGFAAVIFD